MCYKQLLFVRFFAAYGKLLTASATTGSKHPATVSGSHTLPKTVLVLSFSLRWLEGTFHGMYNLNVLSFKNGLQI